MTEHGTAGASARAEGERRRARQAERKRADIAARPVLGRIKHALDVAPDAGRNWEVGAAAEERLGRALDALGADVVLLHDRRIPRSRANIDHIAIAPSGVWVIDAKRYTGRVSKVDKGGWLREDHRLTVGGRDRTSLVHGVTRQVRLVEDALRVVSDAPVCGVVCFVDATWSLFAKPFTIDHVVVTWPKALCDRLRAAGSLDRNTRDAVLRHLASRFPSHG